MKKAHLREINRINASIPKELTDNLMMKRFISPTIREIVKRALANPEEVKNIVSPQQLEKYKIMLESGELDKTEEVPNPEIEKKINDYLDAEFEKARKLGRLPPPQKFPKLKLKSKQLYAKDNKNISSEASNQ